MKILPNSTIGILGSWQLGWMLVLAAGGYNRFEYGTDFYPGKKICWLLESVVAKVGGKMTTFLHKELSYTVRGVLFNVYNQLGAMLPEQFYQEAVAIGLERKGIPCETEKQCEVIYRGVEVGRYFVDVWVEGGKILLELKVAPSISPLHKAQAISYLKVTDADLAFVVNFGEGSLIDERLPNFVRDKQVPFEWAPQVVLPDVPDPKLVEEIFRALHRIHFELGPGFLHQVYRRATRVELREQQISFDYIKKMPVIYAGTVLGQQETRLICVENQVLVATLAVKEIDAAMKQMMRSRMKRLDIGFGLLANFNRTELEVRLVRV